jgi:hypothetical protein
MVVCEVSEHVRDPKVCETRLAVPGNQDVVLDAPAVNMELIHCFVLPTGMMSPCKIRNP